MGRLLADLSRTDSDLRLAGAWTKAFFVRENRERGEIPRRAQRCEGNWRDKSHWLRPGRRPAGLNPSQKTGRQDMACSARTTEPARHHQGE